MILDFRKKVILENLEKVKFIAHRIHRKLPSSIEIDDLIQAGTIGLIDASKKFDPKKNTSFQTYSEFRIRGAILDYLRDRDFFPRSAREKSRKEGCEIEYPFVQIDNLSAKDKNILREGSVLLSKDPLEKMETSERIREIISLSEKYKEREQKIFNMYYLNEMTESQIGKYFKITESRVSQILRKMIVEIRKKVA